MAPTTYGRPLLGSGVPLAKTNISSHATGQVDQSDHKKWSSYTFDDKHLNIKRKSSPSSSSTSSTSFHAHLAQMAKKGRFPLIFILFFLLTTSAVVVQCKFSC